MDPGFASDGPTGEVEAYGLVHMWALAIEASRSSREGGHTAGRSGSREAPAGVAPGSASPSTTTRGVRP